MYRNASPSLRRRLLKNIDVRSLFECWPWTGHVERNGYGRIRVGGRGSTKAPSHRVAYWLLVLNGEEMREDDPRLALEVDHTCENPLCHNPAHLNLIPPRENNFYRHHGRDAKFTPDHHLPQSDLDDMDDMLMNEECG